MKLPDRLAALLTMYIWKQSASKATLTETGILAQEILHLPFCFHLSLLCVWSYSDNMAAAMAQSL